MSEKGYEFLIYEKKDGVARIFFNNPKKLNAMGIPMLTELRDALLDAESDDGVKVMVLSGAGDRSFSVGQDLSPAGGRGQSAESAPISRPIGTYNYLRNVCYETHRLMERMEKPIIAAVNGYCFAGGLEFALACDFMIASENAAFGILEVGLGILPGSGGIVRFSRAISSRKAKELLYTAGRITAKEAEAMGLVNKVVPQGQLESAVKEITDSICAKSLLAIRLAKMVANYSLETPDIDSALALERTACSLIQASEDSTEGARAFMEKRPPVFKGR